MGVSQATPQTISRQLQRRQARQIRPATTKERGDLLRSVGMAKCRLRVRMRLRNNVASRKRILDIKLKQASQGDAAMDRGYAKFSLFNAIVKPNSSYVCRLRDNSGYEITETRDLTDADRVAGVLSDQIVSLGNQSSKSRIKPDHPVRLICVKCSEHTTRSKYKGTSTGPSSDGILRIATNLLDIPTEIIALIYAQRWQIEIFFRFFKQFLSCSHLLSHRQNGIEIQAYCAIIACMLINLWTGGKATKRTFEMICHYMSGLASEDELAAYFAKLKEREEKLRREKSQREGET